jgi:chemotaxis protein MotB
VKNDQVVIIKKKRHGKHGHHGGAWKVAYADFVTAMMAFFLVMWIIAQSAATRAVIAAYFRDPGVFETTRQIGVLSGDASGVSAADTPVDVEKARAALESAAAAMRRALESSPEFTALKDNVLIEFTAEGLRIDLLESATGGFFEVGSSKLKPESVRLLGVIAAQLGQLPNHVAIEGHTDSRPYQVNDMFSNWELSSDRANAARRVMQQTGLAPGQVEAVRGYADTRLRYKGSPLDARNRRVSILVRRLDHPEPNVTPGSPSPASASPAAANGAADAPRATPPAAAADHAAAGHAPKGH